MSIVPEQPCIIQCVLLCVCMKILRRSVMYQVSGDHPAGYPLHEAVLRKVGGDMMGGRGI